MEVKVGDLFKTYNTYYVVIGFTKYNLLSIKGDVICHVLVLNGKYQHNDSFPLNYFRKLLGEYGLLRSYDYHGIKE